MLSSKNNNSGSSQSISRRQFVATSAAVLTTTTLSALPFTNSVKTETKLTVQDIINIITREIQNAPYKQTVDTLKSGSADQIVSGIVTTMFPTLSVIKQAVALKANFIIVHEPTFYNHADEVAWLTSDDVYAVKKALLEKNNIAVWRCHDYLHSRKLDGVQRGVFNMMGWEKHYNAQNPRLLELPSPMLLSEIIDQLKIKLQIKTLRFIGDSKQTCQKIVVLPGAVGGRGQIISLQEEQPDLLICGELQEWETAEYVRDAREAGKQLSLIVTGHIASEEPGLAWLKDWLQPKIGEVKVTHIPSENPFTFA